MNDVDPGRIGQVDRPGYQRHLGAGIGGRAGDGVALPAGGAIGDVAHRIDWFMGRPGSDDDAPALQRLDPLVAAQQLLDCSDDFQRLGHAAEAVLAALGHRARVRPHAGDAVGGQQREIAPGRRVLPHARVHRRGDQHRPVGREQNRGSEIVAMAARHLGQQVGGCRRHHDEIRFARQPDVADIKLALRIEQVGKNATTAERPGRQRRDELLRRRGQDAAHRRPALAQPADEVKALIGRDATGNDQKNAPSLEHRGTVGKGVRNHFTLSTAEIGGKAVRRRHFLLITEKIQEHGSITLASTLLIREP